MAVEAIVSVILQQLTSITIETAREASWNLEEEVRTLESNLKAIQWELEDAEEKQYKNESVKHWLDQFKEVSYDMEDVLEDWRIAFQNQKIASIPKWKVLRFLPCCFLGYDHHDIVTRIRKVTQELDQIVTNKDRFKLIRREVKQLAPIRHDSTSFVVVSELHGLNSTKEDIMAKLLNGDGDTLALVGMGGIGKTALAQLVYNDERIEAHFDYKIWVYVADPFDHCQIATEILRGLDPVSTYVQNSNPSLQSLLREIVKKTEGKKLFLVLDDVWTDRNQDWNPFKVAFRSSPGSRVLVTTRKDSVAKNMAKSSHVFYLNPLSDQACWLIVSQVAFEGRNKAEHTNLEAIGHKIAKKCKGLPLVARTLGGLLKEKQSVKEWLTVLRSPIWEFDLAQEDIFRPLLLSYYDLPLAIRQCLLYCAIFPKDYCLRKSELIQHWMAQGYLNSELKGEDHFRCLASRSFFQDFEKVNDKIHACKMHDIVHDFLQFLTKSEFVSEEVKNSGEHLALDISSKKARRLRLVIARGGHFPESVRGTEKLRSLVVVNSGFDIPRSALHNLLSVSKRLRLLEFGLGHASKVKMIPDEIGNLIHLRFLGLRHSCIRRIPESICELHNLESLDLRECYELEKLPDGIGKLISLKYLSTEDCNGLTSYPKGIASLTSLVGLTDIIARVDRNDTKEFSIGDLENLNLLHERLFVEVVGNNAIDMNEIRRAKLEKKEHLNEMHVTRIKGNISRSSIVQFQHIPLASRVWGHEEKNNHTAIDVAPLFRCSRTSGKETSGI